MATKVNEGAGSGAEQASGEGENRRQFFVELAMAGVAAVTTVVGSDLARAAVPPPSDELAKCGKVRDGAEKTYCDPKNATDRLKFAADFRRIVEKECWAGFDPMKFPDLQTCLEEFFMLVMGKLTKTYGTVCLYQIPGGDLLKLEILMSQKDEGKPVLVGYVKFFVGNDFDKDGKITGYFGQPYTDAAICKGEKPGERDIKDFPPMKKLPPSKAEKK